LRKYYEGLHQLPDYKEKTIGLFEVDAQDQKIASTEE